MFYLLTKTLLHKQQKRVESQLVALCTERKYDIYGNLDVRQVRMYCYCCIKVSTLLLVFTQINHYLKVAMSFCEGIVPEWTEEGAEVCVLLQGNSETTEGILRGRQCFSRGDCFERWQEVKNPQWYKETLNWITLMLHTFMYLILVPFYLCDRPQNQICNILILFASVQTKYIVQFYCFIVLTKEDSQCTYLKPD